MRLASRSAIADLVEKHRRRTRAPAIGVALVPAAGEPTVVVCGERVRDGGVPVVVTDRWHIGSCMKVMTAAVMARFVERGQLQWSTPVPELFDARASHAGWREVSIADVLTHTAGVPANPTAAQLRAALGDPAPLPLQRSRLAEQSLAAAPVRAGRFRYSNLGYAQQGSNARWVATAVVSPDRSAAALVTCNDGRTRMLTSTLRLAIDLMASSAR